MPTWTNELPPEPSAPALPIRRTPARKPLVAVVTSEDLVGTYTHFYHGRTMPCEAPDCEPCSKGQPYRWHAYFAAWEPDTALHFLFECTAQAAENFVQYRKAYGRLRRCKFQATRWRSAPNGRVLIRTKPDELQDRILPQAPDLVACLSVLWNLPSSELAADFQEPEKETAHVNLIGSQTPPATAADPTSTTTKTPVP